MIYIKYLAAVLVGLGSGVVISGAVLAFISMIGVVPRLAQKTKTPGFIKLYEQALMVGGMFGALTMPFDIRIPANPAFIVYLSLCGGVFVGCLAVSLAEILDVIPILSRRVRLTTGIYFFMVALALGKLSGSLIYFISGKFFKFD